MKHILVVDDEPPVLDLLLQFLRRRGFLATGARTGAEALRLAQIIHPDAVTLDLDLGNEEGLPVLVRLQAQHSGLPVLVVTAADLDHRFREQIRDCGAAGSVGKSFLVEQLLPELERVLRLRLAA